MKFDSTSLPYEKEKYHTLVQKNQLNHHRGKNNNLLTYGKVRSMSRSMPINGAMTTVSIEAMAL